MERFLVRSIKKIKLPRIALAVLASVPLIIFEEHINCGAYGCTNVIIPPTLWFLLIMELLLFGIIKLSGIKKNFLQTILLSFLGMLFEFFIGSSRTGLHQLVATKPLIFLLIMVWVGFSYAFAFFLPLLILNIS